MKEDKNRPDARWGEPSPLHDPYLLANFQPRATDVLITTAPKAGTTWMQQILHQLRSGGDTSFDSINAVVPWLEIHREGKSWQQLLQEFEAIENPRIFKTHCTAPQTPGIDTAKIILTSRDPRDCCVSFYHHIHNMTTAARAHSGITLPATFDEHVDSWMGFAAWYRNVQSWWPYHDHPNVLWLRFHDLKQDLGQGIDRITHFLNWELSSTQRARVLEYSAFPWMKQHDHKFSSQGTSGNPVFKPGKFIRQGKNASYGELMTPAQEQRILGMARDMLEPACLRFIGLDKATRFTHTP